MIAEKAVGTSRLRTQYVLVIEDNLDHQLLIGYSLQAALPNVEPVFVSSPEQALTYLEQALNQEKCFPKLACLDLYLPRVETGWQLLKQIRALYPFLPLIVLSAQSDQGHALQAYCLGAHSFIAKPLTLSEWETCFQQLGTYWFETVTLPPIG